MNTNETAAFLGQMSDAVMKPLKGFSYHLIAGIVIGAILAIGVRVGLQRMGVSRRAAGQLASVVLTLSVVISLVMFMVTLR